MLRIRGGFEVVGEASDGEQALDLALTCSPDIVVLDLGLPRLAGREVLGRLREQLPRVKVVVFTGTEMADKDDLRERVEGFVVKDSDVSYLVDLLEHLGSATQQAAVLALRREPASPRRARQFLLNHCARWGCEDDVVESARLVVSELVTNAVSHANSSCELRLELSDGSLRVEVTDCGTGTPDPLAATEQDEHGRGLLIVSALTTAWGVETVDGGAKTVWAQITISPAAGTPAA